MIHKIEELKSIGKFRNYLASGQVNLNKLNLIFGDNGSGKTTLTSVFRSLATNNPDIINYRKSTNSTTQPFAKIIKNGNTNVTHTFDANGWSAPLNDIEIFDIHFINENIYSGFNFSDEHKKQLHKFVIGAQGVSIQRQIEVNKNEKATIRQLISQIEQQILQKVGNGLSLEQIQAFIRIDTTQSEGIDTKLQLAEKALENANSNAVIRTLPSLMPLPLLSTIIDYDKLVDDLKKTTQQIQDNTLELIFKEHCKELTDNGIDGVENWLQKGFSYIKSKKKSNLSNSSEELKCPFCKQTIEDNLQIINAYTLQFNETFNKLVQEIREYLNTVQSYNLDSEIQSINNAYQNNINAISSWTKHLSKEVKVPIFNFDSEDQTIKKQLDKVQADIARKLQNPSEAVFTDSITLFRNVLVKINKSISEYNNAVQNYNSAILAFKNSIQTIDQAQNELSSLKRIKQRFETTVNDLCNQLVTKKAELRTLEQNYSGLVSQQETDSNRFFVNYKDKINYYLNTVFQTPFRIENVEHISPQGRALESKLGYKLTIDGLDISFAHNVILNAKDCLSEGDKSTIALAFFLSKLDIDTNKQNKILVFDDPLSSLDTNRRTKTIGTIKQLIPQIKQIIVLSHNELFLHEISDRIHLNDKTILRITENFQTKESKIETCDLNKLVKNDYFKHIDELEAFLIHPDLTKKDYILGLLRNVLEAHLRFKFYRDIRRMTGQPTFGRLISFIESSSIVFKDNNNRRSIIDKMYLINSVSWKQHHGTAAPDFSTLSVNPNTITVPELVGLINDTISLIENEL